MGDNNIKIENKYVSNGKLEKNLSKYYLESDASKQIIKEVIDDLVEQVNEMTNIASLEGIMEARIVPTRKLLR